MENSELNLQFSNRIKVTKVKFEFTCNKCGHSWAVFLSATGRLPLNSDVCVACASENTKSLVMRGNSNGNKNLR